MGTSESKKNEFTIHQIKSKINNCDNGNNCKFSHNAMQVAFRMSLTQNVGHFEHELLSISIPILFATKKHSIPLKKGGRGTPALLIPGTPMSILQVIFHYRYNSLYLAGGAFRGRSRIFKEDEKLLFFTNSIAK